LLGSVPLNLQCAYKCSAVRKLIDDIGLERFDGFPILPGTSEQEFGLKLHCLIAKGNTFRLRINEFIDTIGYAVLALKVDQHSTLSDLATTEQFHHISQILSSSIKPHHSQWTSGEVFFHSLLQLGGLIEMIPQEQNAKRIIMVFLSILPDETFSIEGAADMVISS
jgi:hypothetical protein